MKFSVDFEKSCCVSFTSSLPLPSSLPTLRRPIVGSFVPKISRAYSAAMIP